MGEPLFAIEAKDENSGQTYFFKSEIATFNIEDLPSSTYSFTVNDVNGNVVVRSNITLDLSDKQLVSLASNWVLPDRGRPLEIRPEIYKLSFEKNLKYSWYFNDKLISKLPRLIVNYSGAFSLVVTDHKGAKEQFFFTVAPSPQTKDVGEEMEWVVSPNPVEWGEEFTITYLFENQKKVDFYAYTQDGKFIFRDELGIIEAGSYNYKLPHSSGTYLLVAIINSKTTIQRLIVK